MATRWRPDTCKCVLLVNDWDTNDAATELACPHHEGLSGSAHMQVVYRGENQLKNFALAEIEAHRQGATTDAVVTFIGRPDSLVRDCEITLPNLPSNQQAAALARVEARLGKNAVRLK